MVCDNAFGIVAARIRNNILPAVTAVFCCSRSYTKPYIVLYIIDPSNYAFFEFFSAV